MTSASFEAALEEFPILIDNSLYHKHLSAYYALFDRCKIGIFMFDKLQANPREFAADVLAFLGVTMIVDLPYERKVLSAARPRSEWLAYTMKRCANLARELRLTSLVGVAKRSSLARLLYRPYDDRGRPKMNNRTRRALQGLFWDDVCALEKLVNIDLSDWRAGGGSD
jgi:hypothetical protein